MTLSQRIEALAGPDRAVDALEAENARLRDVMNWAAIRLGIIADGDEKEGNHTRAELVRGWALAAALGQALPPPPEQGQ